MDDKYESVTPEQLLLQLAALEAKAGEIAAQRRDILEAITQKLTDPNRSLSYVLQKLNDIRTQMQELHPKRVEPPHDEQVQASGAPGKPYPVRHRERAVVRLTEHIVSLLADAQRPMMPAEIVEELGKRGVTVNGSRPANNVAAHLSYSPRFVKSPDGKGWLLRENVLGLTHKKETPPTEGARSE